MEKQVILRPLNHDGRECIGIYFETDSKLNGAIRRNAGAMWSPIEKAWYVPLSRDNYNKLVFAIKGKGVIEYSALYKYLSDKKKVNVSTTPASHYNKPVIDEKLTMVPPVKNVKDSNAGAGYNITPYKNRKISSVNAHVLPAMLQQLKLKAYNSSTIRTYLGEMSQLLALLKEISVDDLQPEHLKRYLVHCVEKLNLTENTLHSRINAMKFYFEKVLGRPNFFLGDSKAKETVDPTQNFK